jgi:hypothetical protein
MTRRPTVLLGTATIRALLHWPWVLSASREWGTEATESQ